MELTASALLFDFTNIFQRLGQRIVRELQQRMLRQVGVDDLRYSTLAASTVRQKAKTSSATANLRMIRTKDFLNRAFKFVASRDYVKVFVSSGLHGRDIRNARKKETRKRLAISRSASGQSYSNIAKWQIDTGAAKFFPTNMLEVENLDAVEVGRREMKAEILKQMRAQGMIKLKQVFQVG